MTPSTNTAKSCVAGSIPARPTKRRPLPTAWIGSSGSTSLLGRPGRLAPKTVEEYGYQARGIIRPALSDLRRTVMTAAAASGIGSHVLRDLLGHRTPDTGHRRWSIATSERSETLSGTRASR